MTSRDYLDPYRRGLQLTLGLIWLLDAALQYQPYMFTRAFAQQELAAAGPGNPDWVAHPVQWAAHLISAHAVGFDALFATIQLLIALGLFTRATVRIALVGSAMWALGIWWMGEGLGGMLAGPQSAVMGAPGAALLYVLISVLLWPREASPDPYASRSVASTGLLGKSVPRLAWLALWVGFGFEALQGANRSPSALHDTIAGMAAGEPAWLRAIDQRAAGALAHHGTEVSIALASLFALVALAVFGSTRIARAGLLAAAGLAAVIWVVGQNLGGIATGQATDPNTGPLLILLAGSLWPIAAPVRMALRAAPLTRSGEPLDQRALVGAELG
jgi:hypothetical protein